MIIYDSVKQRLEARTQRGVSWLALLRVISRACSVHVRSRLVYRRCFASDFTGFSGPVRSKRAVPAQTHRRCSQARSSSSPTRSLTAEGYAVPTSIRSAGRAQPPVPVKGDSIWSLSRVLFVTCPREGCLFSEALPWKDAGRKGL